MEALEVLHIDNHGGRHNYQIQTLRDEVNLLLYEDEIYWRQQSRKVWLMAGDKNTRFFRQKAMQRYGKNMIKGLLDNSGTWCEEETRMGEIVVQYFKEMFSTSLGLEVRTL